VDKSEPSRADYFAIVRKPPDHPPMMQIMASTAVIDHSQISHDGTEDAAEAAAHGAQQTLLLRRDGCQ
jgi:hypothetical protein